MVTWNPYTPGYFDDPYPHLAACRSTNPVQKGIHKEWILLRHKHVRHVLKSDEFDASNLSGYFASKEKMIFGESACPFLARGTRRWIMYLNGAEHIVTSDLADAALRKIDFPALIEEAIDACLPEFKNAAGFNLVDLAAMIPFYLSKKMTGFDESVSYEKLRDFSFRLAVSQDMFLTKDDYRRVNEEFEWAFREFKTMLAPGGNRPQETLAAILPGLNIGSTHPHSEDDMFSLVSILFMASFETTKDALSTILTELIKRPGLMQYVVDADERQIKVLTEELLRIACPLQYTVRVCKEDMELDGQLFTAGTKLYLGLASANRDEEVFENPNEIIPDRKENPQLAFGGGVHACLGARIARQEIRTWLKPLCLFLINYRIPDNETPQWQKTIFMRGLRQLNLVRK
jgi:cytochrome P450